MVQEGIASADDVEEALKAGAGLRWPVYGPFEHADVVGTKLSLAVQAAVLPSLCNATEPAQLSEGYVGRRTSRHPVRSGVSRLDRSQRGRIAAQARSLAGGAHEGCAGRKLGFTKESDSSSNANCPVPQTSGHSIDIGQNAEVVL